MAKKNTIALICCRGGSKGVPNKNLKNFAGKPILYWTYKAISQSKLFGEILISTDSRKINNMAQKIGYHSTGLRPSKLASDSSDQFRTHNYVFNKMKINDKNSIVCIVNNNPFITKKYLKKTYDLFKLGNFNIIATDAAEVSTDFQYYKQGYMKKNKLEFKFKNKFKNSKINRQSNKKLFVNMFNIRWGKPSQLNSYNNFKQTLINDGNYFVKIDKKFLFDIDDLEDWYLAEKIFNVLKNDKYI